MNNIITEKLAEKNNVFANDFLDNIAIAVVKQAVEDYRELKQQGVEETAEIYDCKIHISIKEIKKFFKSSWAGVLTLDTAEYIFDRVQKECEG